MLNCDQHFLLYFIIGNYFGPHLKEESPQKSILQRITEGLSTYTSDQLVGSRMKTVEVERVYYYALRKAEKSLSVKLPMLHHFFCGTIPTSANDLSDIYPQFPDLFPPQLHPQSNFNQRYKMIENIIFINDPDISYIKPEDIERFKRLTGLENLLLDRDAARYHISLDGCTLHNVEVQEAKPVAESLLYDVEVQEAKPVAVSLLYNVEVQEAKPVAESHPFRPSHSPCRAKHGDSALQSKDQHVLVVEPLNSVPCNALPPVQSNTTLPYRNDTTTMGKVNPGMLFLPSCPNRKEWDRIIAAGKGGFAVTGTAAMGQVGHIVGLMDIGESEDSYMFRISLPGVKRDEEEFSCEVDNDGKVLIKGVTTTGETTVYRFSQVFHMQSKNLCPPGEFSIAFKLPGPVNPQQFSGNFGTDGILEGIVMKRKHES